jgi:hypothetical protein
MQKLTEWAAANPSAAASVASAIIAASVALVVFTITQAIARKRDAVQLLLPKLEQVYLLLNDLSEENVRIFKLYHFAMEGNEEAQKKLNDMDDLKHYGLDRGKKIVMYIRLYFPQLAQIHQLLFAAEHIQNMLYYAARSDNPPAIDDILDAGGQVGHFIRLMEQEMIENRDVLLKANWLPRRYKAVTQAEIDNPMPRPDGPFIHPEGGIKNAGAPTAAG